MTATCYICDGEKHFPGCVFYGVASRVEQDPLRSGRWVYDDEGAESD